MSLLHYLACRAYMEVTTCDIMVHVTRPQYTRSTYTHADEMNCTVRSRDRASRVVQEIEFMISHKSNLLFLTNTPREHYPTRELHINNARSVKAERVYKVKCSACVLHVRRTCSIGENARENCVFHGKSICI